VGYKVKPPTLCLALPEISAKIEKTVNNQNSVSVPAQLYTHEDGEKENCGHLGAMGHKITNVLLILKIQDINFCFWAN
jgi:hypothetical protein